MIRRPQISHLEDDDLEVVFISDDPALAETYRLKLELDGYWVTTCATIDDGLQHVRTRMPDLVFIDLGPGSRRRPEELGLLRRDARLRETPIVLLARGESKAAEPESTHLGNRVFVVRVHSVPGEESWSNTRH